jgi:phage shock protein PspC (stress-responsive transcriptional regulator)
MDETEDVKDVVVVDAAAEADDANTARTTLHRSSTKKVIGGVAGGIAERFDIDANIVRVVFVVVALAYGLGVAIYLAMWVLIPKSASLEGVDSAVLEESSEHRRHWLRYAVALGVVVLVLILFAALHHGLSPGSGRGLTYLWLIFLVVLAIISLRTPARRLTIRRFLALCFLGFLSLLIVVSGAFLLTLQVIGVPLEGGSGARAWHPISPAEVQRTYHGTFGKSMIDLSRVHFPPGTRYITATQGVGLLVVELPRNVTLDLGTHVGIGNVQRWYYHDPSAVSGTSSTAASSTSKSSGTLLVLNLQVGVGQIQVLRPIG